MSAGGWRISVQIASQASASPKSVRTNSDASVVGSFFIASLHVLVPTNYEYTATPAVYRAAAGGCSRHAIQLPKLPPPSFPRSQHGSRNAPRWIASRILAGAITAGKER